ncbi:MAG: hypothetical protein IJR68_06535 [Fretibacterium sp.]|nr:hypothetical protein [Fretibacterium sp.]
MKESLGYYSLKQLSSQAETNRFKARVGVFPWNARTIERMWARGEFPQPLLWGGRNVWKKEVINAFSRLIGQGMEPAEAVVQADAAAV